MVTFDDASLAKVLGLLDAVRVAADEVNGWETQIEHIGEALAEMEKAGIAAGSVRELFGALERWQSSAGAALGLMRLRTLRLLQQPTGPSGPDEAGGDAGGVREPLLPVGPTGGVGEARKEPLTQAAPTAMRGFLIDEDPSV
ncbi:hypothetical protein KGQ20_02690 [Catenulispora sp. NF23]|uniref:hypothetical protein n=1 Tax=Catenulispora pinistramenti TaxID=2705254 RepID=UPI001BAD0463|nr:hypothetical protein [Catenulispora pinistramenti]MBS2531673.1 hypothetical protein [Catenulispora pinistramenti]